MRKGRTYLSIVQKGLKDPDTKWNSYACAVRNGIRRIDGIGKGGLCWQWKIH